MDPRTQVTVCFSGVQEVTVASGTKLLVAARKKQIPIRFSCAACQCGTCAVKVDPIHHLSVMREDEQKLLQKIGLPLDGTVRLSCQARAMSGHTDVDLEFQDQYEIPEDT